MIYNMFVNSIIMLLSIGFFSVFVALGLFCAVYLFDLLRKGRKECE